MSAASGSQGRRPALSASVDVVGSGWLGAALAAAAGVTSIRRRTFQPSEIEKASLVYVASGLSSLPAGEGFAGVLRTELRHLREVLDACERAEARRIVVLGSADVVGLAADVDGDTPQDPLTPYARVKAAVEDECRLRAAGGMPVTCVRLAPVHGPGKSRTATLVRLARAPVIPVPGGGRHSIGFVLLADAVRALLHLGNELSPSVVSIGGGATPLRNLIRHLAQAQGRKPTLVPVPLPRGALSRFGPIPLPETAHWLLRLSLPRAVAMQVPVPVTPLPEAAAMLVAAC